MDNSTHLSDNLALLTHETSLLMRTAASLDDGTIRGASLCEGWSRAHVLSHIARNADALGNLVEWAVTGSPRPMYASPESRDADIAAGSTRGAQEILTDLEESASRFAVAATGLTGGPEQVEVEMRGGSKVLGGRLPTLRLMEVVMHHVDLDAGYTFADADPGFVRRTVSNAVQRMSAGAQTSSLLLRGDDGDTWSIGEGGRDDGSRDEGGQGQRAQVVSGSNAALLLWLARGDRRGLSSDVPPPTLPAWG